ncbi:hypothetical protein QN277_001755 [Acacia crassicarpa]|uniref:Uncharacterized protein n=1 Tax=Acacia crassicarpa TaxID=499986 RepID=A0AAE1TH54_9FABA|nr:hypothetical protein QN277_001755 [Acacia crassicarpa]
MINVFPYNFIISKSYVSTQGLLSSEHTPAEGREQYRKGAVLGPELWLGDSKFDLHSLQLSIHRSRQLRAFVRSRRLPLDRHDSSLTKQHADSVQMISESSNNSVKSSVLLPYHDLPHLPSCNYQQFHGLALFLPGQYF